MLRVSCFLIAVWVVNMPVLALKLEGWTPENRTRLTQLIADQKGKGLKVVFDFDNTLLCRDIGEATLGVLMKENAIQKNAIPTGISPSFLLNGKKVELAQNSLSFYYEAFGEATKHQKTDKEPFVESYAWLVQMMAGLKPSQIVAATQKAYAEGIGKKDVGNSNEEYRRPFFYPEMVELVAELITNGYEVWVISASNVWSVRWMVNFALNPQLKALGVAEGIQPQHVIGISTLIEDEAGQLYKDASLARENKAYASMDPESLSAYRLTSSIAYPLSSCEGKVANIFKWIGEQPYLVAGDSDNDLAMLQYGKNRLWMARLEKTELQEKVASHLSKEPGSWIVQPVLYTKSPGFVSSHQTLTKRLRNFPNNVKKSLALLKNAKVLAWHTGS